MGGCSSSEKKKNYTVARREEIDFDTLHRAERVGVVPQGVNLSFEELEEVQRREALNPINLFVVDASTGTSRGKPRKLSVHLWEDVKSSLTRAGRCAALEHASIKKKSLAFWETWESLAVPPNTQVVVRFEKILTACDMVLEGHSDAVSSLAPLSDGKLASASKDLTISVWRLRAQFQEQVLEGHEGYVYAVIDLGERRFISGAWDHTLRLWSWDKEAKAFESQRIVRGHKGEVYDIARLEGNKLASVSFDKTIRIWNEEGVCEQVLQGHSETVTSVAGLSHGCIVTGSKDGSVRTWAIGTGECLNVMNGHNGYVNCVAAMPFARVASGSDDCTIRIWTMEGCCEHTFQGHREPVLSLAPMEYGRLASGSQDWTVRVWGSTGVCEHVLPGHTDAVLAVAYLGNGMLASGGKDTTVRVWGTDTEDGTELPTLPEPKTPRDRKARLIPVI